MPANKTIALLGTGHLGSALAAGLIQAQLPAHSILVTNRNPKKLADLIARLGVSSAKTNTEAAEAADIIILAVKPQSIKELCLELSTTVQKKRPLIISLAGVISTEDIAHWLGNNELGIVRVMTNTPIEYCKGTTALFANEHVTQAQKETSETIFNKVGITFWTQDQKMLNTLTAPIGSAPAYVFLFMEALQEAAINRGIPKEFATKIALEAVVGAATLASQSMSTFAELRAGVATAKGVTEHSMNKISIPEFFDTFKVLFSAVEERIGEIEKTML